MAECQRFTLNNKDCTFNVYKYGEGKKIMLIVHGAATEALGFEDFINLLGEEWTVFVYDRRGYGKNDSASDYNFLEQANDLKVVADYINKPFTLFAHSLGSSIALAYAYQHPQLISKLILYEPFLAGILPKEHWYYGLLDKTKLFLKDGKRADAMNLFFSIISYEKEKRRPLSRQLLLTMRKNFDVFFEGEFIDSTLFKLEYKELPMPVYVGLGEQSRGGVVEEGIVLLKEKVDFEFFNTCGAHNMYYDRPQEFYQSIIKFL